MLTSKQRAQLRAMASTEDTIIIVDPEREYGFAFEGYSVKFKVPDADTLVVTSLQA